MANQMIALQARGPQLPDVGAINARYANIMANMATAREKQNAAQRAAEFRTRAESGVDVLTPEGFNQLSGLDPEGAAALRKSALEKQKADAEFTLGYLGTVNEELQRANTPEQALAIGQSLKEAYPMFAKNIDQTLAKMPTDISKFPAFRQQLNLSALKASERIKYELEQVKSKELIGEGGDVGVLTTGGLGAPTIKVPKTMVPAPARGGTVEMGEQTTVEPGAAGVDENAPVSAEDAEAFIASFPKAAQPAIRQRIMQGALGNIPMGSPVAPQGLVAGERGGVGGPDEGYVESATPFRAKNPSVAPYPGSAQVPITRVREEAIAQRKTPTETYAETRSTKQAESDVKFLDTVGAAKDQARNVLSVIDQMIGDLNVKDNKLVTGKRAPHGGFESVIGAGIPGLRFIPGTQSADFDAFMEQVEGGAFLDAYESLKGTGQITEKEGEKATSAITRMKRSSSEVGFVKAAREFQDIVRRGLERAEAREARLRGGTPTAKSGGGKRLRYNPATGEVE